MTTQTAYTLINPQTRELAFKIYEFEDDSYFRAHRLFNYYSILLVTEGTGNLKAESSEYIFEPNTVMCFSVYQPFIINADSEFKGILVNFHPDFFCIHKHQQEVACNGVLFNNLYDPPLMKVGEEEMSNLKNILITLKEEMQNTALAQYEFMVAYLKIFLIQSSRLKINSQPNLEHKGEKEYYLLQNLKDAIEEHYRKKHSPGDYADLLNISTKALNRISKIHLNKTLRNLIAERLIIEAKRELYLTSKTVKMIAYELGFEDVFYFSRFFKNNTAISPQLYRDTVGFDKGSVS